MLKIATWNVNSLRVRLPQVLDWLASQRPTVLALQETKLTNAEFPVAALEAAGYQVLFNGQKTYNGVAMLSQTLATEPVLTLPDRDEPLQRRVLAATVAGVRVVNLYVPNGQAVDSDKYQYKLAWLASLQTYLADELRRHPRLVVLGDFNIAPADADVHDPAAWAGKVLCSEAERSAFQGLLDLGLQDTLRLHSPDAGIYSWWDYRAAGFRRNLGMRIDHILASAPLAAQCHNSWVDREPRGWERPSDHTPVVAEFTV